jgi:tetratricopeptide (TPR) repeat protein
MAQLRQTSGPGTLTNTVAAVRRGGADSGFGVPCFRSRPPMANCAANDKELPMTARSMRASLWIVLAVLLAATAAGAQSEDDLRALNQETLQLLEAGTRPDAIATAVAAVADAEHRFGPDRPDVGDAVSKLAGLYQFAGKYDAAEPLYRRALAISEKASGGDNVDVAFHLDRLAALYRIQRRYTEAEALLKRSLTIREKAFGAGDLEVAPSVESLAVLYQAQNRSADAEPYLRRSRDIRQKALGPDHAEVGQSLHELARFYRVQGRVPEAGQSYDRAVAILGSHHPEVILAAIKAGKYDEAARAIGRKDLAGLSQEAVARAVRQTFFGQVTDLRWTRSSSGQNAMMIEGEATHGNQLWQPFAVFMARDGGEWTLRSVKTSGLAFK